MQLAIAILCAAIIFGALDAIWLRWAGSNLYRPNIGQVMAEDFRMAPALIFYVIYLAGMAWFILAPALALALLGELHSGAGCLPLVV